MLRHISITNYALISHIEVDFDKGFTAITGETGAGKSILLGALNLISGQRADTKVLKNPEKKCIIEAQFDIGSYRLKPLFDENDWDYHEQSIIRREILPSGKSRAFVNDTPVRLDKLQELGKHLIDIHSQHHNRLLNENSFPFSLVDNYAGIQELYHTYLGHFKEYHRLANLLDEKNSRQNSLKQQKEYLQFQLEELRKAGFSPGEQEQLEKDVIKGENAERILLNLSSAFDQLYNSDDSLHTRLYDIKKIIGEISAFDDLYSEIHDRLANLYTEISDIADTLFRQIDRTEINPGKIERDKERLSLLYSLLQKHQALNLEELIRIEQDIEEKLRTIRLGDSELESIKMELEQLEKKIDAESKKLHRQRIKAIPEIEKQILGILGQLGLPAAKFKIEITEKKQAGKYGITGLRMLFSANKGQDLKELKNVASGGEMSRIMFAIKYIMTLHTQLPTLILDEIDTGISGEIARRTGSLMQSAGKYIQLISITHLPQIAAKADTHLKVYKTSRDDSTETLLKHLEKDERIREIAGMISGENPETTAIEHAKELLK